MDRLHSRNGRGLLGACLAALGLAAVGGGAGPAAAAFCPNEALRIEQQSTHLPDCRAYEMVTPPDKNGIDISVHPTRTRVSATESPGQPLALVYTALGGFGEVHGSGIGFEYLAQRTGGPGTSGWASHGTTPLQEPMSFEDASQSAEAMYVGYDLNLTRGIFRAFSPLGPAPNSDDIQNLYVRTDLRSPGPGTYQLRTEPFAPVTPVPGDQQVPAHMRVAGVTPDASHLLFYTVYQLTPDAPASTDLVKTYLSTEGGGLAFVGKIPTSGSSCTGAGCIAVTDASVIPGAARMPTMVLGGRHSLSADGSRAFFTVSKATTPVAGTEGNLFLRDTKGTVAPTDDTTTKVNASERVIDTGSTVRYEDAAVDGSVAYFTTPSSLTEDAPTAQGKKLYRWTYAPNGAGKRLTYLSADHEPADALGPVAGVIGTNESGDTVYFLATGQIVSGEPVLNGGLGIYMWREGAGVTYVGQMVDNGDDAKMNVPPATGPDDQLGSRVSPDGDFLLISLHYPPWPGGADHGDCPETSVHAVEIDGKHGCSQLYRYDAEAGGEPLCVSCHPDGSAASNGSVFFQPYRPGAILALPYLNSPMSEDGKTVFFSTDEPLLEEDTNGTTDVYMWEVAGHGSCAAAEVEGCINLISTGTSPQPSFFIEAAKTGSDAFIGTSQQLTGWDVDGSRDIYDVRIGGGLPEPTPLSAPCSGDACVPSTPGPPSPTTPASAVLAGGGNVKPDRPVRCKRKERRVRRNGKIRCVPKRRGRNRGTRANRSGGERRADR